MKVLWFSPINTVGQFAKDSRAYNGGGWIDGLQRAIREVENIELAVAWPNSVALEAFSSEGVRHYPVTIPQPSIAKKILTYWGLDNIDNRKLITSEIQRVIADFKPDIVHLFGIESIFAEALLEMPCTVPVIVHLQGFLYPCSVAFFPPGINRNTIFRKGNRIRELIIRNGLDFAFRSIKTRGALELQTFAKVKYAMGRTHWDNMYMQQIVPLGHYFHVGEVLRQPFYDSSPWQLKQENDKCIIISTISDTMYKGLDVVLKCAQFLRTATDISFEWKIIGVSKKSLTVGLFENALRIKASEVNVRFLGVIGPDEIVGALSNADMYLHPSYIDNSPNSLCEAQLLGLPCIATDVGGISTLIEHGSDGFLVPANDIQQMAFYIRKIHLEKDEVLKVSVNGRSHALSRHDPSKVRRSLVESYNTVLKIHAFQPEICK